MTQRHWLLVMVLGVGCGGGNTPQDGGALDAPPGDAPAGECASATDGTACGSAMICVSGACVASECGDGVVDERSEDCDDANTTAFDGCEPTTCTFTCSTDTGCDDSVQCNGAETCDTESTHRCVGGSPLVDGAECTLAGGTGSCREGICVVVGCGNGVLEGDEHCDDGNTTARDGCETDCRLTCEIDTTMTNTWHLDCDGDGYAATGAPSQMQCLRPAPNVCGGGWTLRAPLAGSADCNDTSAATRPGAVETCDLADNDCNGSTDEGVQTTFFRDVDGDGFGDPAMTMMACTVPSGFVASSTDCNDSCVSCHPGGTETCDGRDNNCAGGIDEGVLLTFYRDGDGDGHGSPTSTMMACTAPPMHVTSADDCDDSDSAAFPGQSQWFTRARMGGGYDFNCDGVGNLRYAFLSPGCDGACPVGFCCDGGSGWVSTVPGCGGSASFRTCNCSGSGSNASQAQECH